MASAPAPCSKKSRMTTSVQLCMELRPDASGGQYSCVWSLYDDRTALGPRLARPRSEGPGAARVCGPEGREARQDDGGVARQLLLAFRRYRRVPRRDPEALARRRGGTNHRRSGDDENK